MARAEYIEDPERIRPPEIAADYLPRPRLARILSGPGCAPVTLVCAPPGFGKTSLVAHWAGEASEPVAWLSVDAEDGDAGNFAQHVIAAVRAISPDTGEQTRRLLRKRNRVEPAEFARALVADLKTVVTPFVLVLEDFSSVESSAVSDAMDELLGGASMAMRLVLIARHDPPLPLHELLRDGRASEIRQSALAFSPQEAAEFLELQTGWAPTEEQLTRIAIRLDGWPTGLRLLANSLADADDRDGVLERLPDGVRQAKRYLCAELFEALAPHEQRSILQCSVLTQFNSALCAALSEPESARLIVDDFPKRDSTFLESVDDRPSWFRIRPLFREFCEDRFRSSFDADAVRELHDRAAGWLSEQGHVGEAIEHALQGRTPNSAAGILADHRMRMVNEGRYPDLITHMGRLPEEVLNSHLDTQLLRVWVTPSAVFEEAVARVEAMLSETELQADRAEAVLGELRLLQAGNMMSLSIADPSGLATLVEHAEEALDKLPIEFRGARAMAYLLLAQTLQYAGRLDAADAALDRGVAEFSIGHGYPLSLIFYARTLVHFGEGDLVKARDAAERCLACQLVVPPETEPFRQQARRLLGKIYAEWNELELAAQTLDHPEARIYPENMKLLAHVLQAQGKDSEATTLMESILETSLGDASELGTMFAHADEALLALRQGRSEPALRWAEGVRTTSIRPFESAVAATLIRAEILVQADGERQRAKAAELLETAKRAATQTHKNHRLVQILALQSLLLATQGDDDGAFAALTESLRLASRSRYMRSYLSLGAAMQSLLARMPVPTGYEEYVASLRREFARERLSSPNRPEQDLADPLSNRERKVLELMAERLSNKEIAGLLHVSVPTVKSHALKIYQKLRVHGRREAVERAAALGILAER